MQLIFIHGPVASGKLTVAKALSKLTDLPLFHNHLCVDLTTSLFDFGTEPFIRLRERVWLGAFEEAAIAGRSLVFTFAPESTVNPSFIERCKKVVEEHEGQVHFIELTCPEEEIEARIENSNRSKFGKLNSIEFYRQLKANGAFTFPELPSPLVSISSHTHTPQEVARIIKEHLDALG
ncbi:MAG: chloramphenicol 3-O-phosphotransferase [Candidatus Promineifilaceae bacterium]|jgi:chloramphenicol 3-O-phosphotransferase